MGRPLIAFLALFFTAGAILLMLLTLLGGATNSTPLNDIYFLQVDTSSIPNAPALSRWTYWGICNTVDGKSVCGNHSPAFPLDPPSHREFDTTQNVPQQFIGTSKYFYETRFMFAFALIAVFFAVISLFVGGLALCTRIGSYLSGFLNWIAWVFQTIATALMTAAYVQGRDAFNSNNETATLGKKAFGFMWAAMFCLLLAGALFCAGGSRKSDSPPRRSFFNRPKRNASTRSRGSFANGVRKDDYA